MRNYLSSHNSQEAGWNGLKRRYYHVVASFLKKGAAYAVYLQIKVTSRINWLCLAIRNLDALLKCWTGHPKLGCLAQVLDSPSKNRMPCSSVGQAIRNSDALLRCWTAHLKLGCLAQVLDRPSETRMPKNQLPKLCSLSARNSFYFELQPH
jgi:hypothetical protein